MAGQSITVGLTLAELRERLAELPQGDRVVGVAEVIDFGPPIPSGHGLIRVATRIYDNHAASSYLLVKTGS
jgi:hypothetical protein